MIPEALLERARELGRHLGQSEEYRALERARARFGEDEEAVQRLTRMQELEREITSALQRGEEPAAEQAAEYEERFSELQGSAVYQALIAAQTNFDKVVARINEEIGRGLETGSRSRIIMPS
jgi:cell fate (sporulation/competence/biofilm development) regulator YlbF (YheA/YmcA/DUF963 family)